MKLKSILILMLCATIPAIACAKKPKALKAAPVDDPRAKVAEMKKEVPVVEEIIPEITEECVVNTSLFTESAKNKQYADALEPWIQVYENCPNYNQSIYKYGAQIIAWQIANAQTVEEKDALKKKLMELYDKRIKWFGDDSKYPTSYILGLKGLDYCTYFTEDTLKLPAYEMLKKSIEGRGNKSQITVVNKFAELATAIYKSNPDVYGDQYIADYQTATGLLVEMSKDATNKNAGIARQYKDYWDGVFAASGAANCDKLDELYAAQVEENANNIDMLNKFILLYSKIGCKESEVYFAASEYAHKLLPTESSAAGCAKMCIKKKEYADAIAYYEQAVTLAEDKYDKADYLYAIAQLYAVMNQLSNSRTYARKALEINPDMGKCYILIGNLYASSKIYGNDAKGRILNKTVFWAAVDKYYKAKAVDSNLTEEANRLIATYSRYFPTKEERFDLPGEFGSGTFTVGGWIGETTTVR